MTSPAPLGRPTRQRAAVSTVLDEITDFRSAQQIHALLRRRGERIGLATVYRTLQSLAEAGRVDVLRRSDGEAVYRRCSDGHHHHLLCRHCGRTIEVDGPGVERWTTRVADQHGFVDVSHQLEIVGTCRDCVEANVASTSSE